MREVCEFRIQEKWAHLLFRPDEGKPLGDEILGYTVRQVYLHTDDPRFIEVGRLEEELHAQGKGMFFSGWHISHHYSKNELESAELFHLMFSNSFFEPVGEECGTQYDYSGACPECGMPRKQVSDLRLDLRKTPKSKDIAATIANDEWIVSQRLAELMVDAKLTGFDLRPVRHKARYEDDPVDLREVPSGQELIRRGQALGLAFPSPEFSIWHSRAEQKELLDQAFAESAGSAARRGMRRRKPLPIWHQLVVTSRPLSAVAPTRFGINPFDEGAEKKYRCSYGHVRGWTLLSEVFVSREEWDGSDIRRTKDLVGHPRRPGQTHGVRVPRPFLLISPRFWRLLRDNKIKGYRAEVAYLR